MCSVQRPRESRVRNREELSRLSVSEISSDQDYYYNTILLLKTAISFDTFFFQRLVIGTKIEHISSTVTKHIIGHLINVR